MSILDALDLHDVDPESGGYDPLPKGDYEMIIVDIEQKENSKGTGELIAVELQIPDDAEEYAGRKVFLNYTVKHENQKAVNIGKARVKALILATKNHAPATLDELIGETVKVTLKVKPAQGDYEASNDVKKFYPSKTEVVETKKGENRPY